MWNDTGELERLTGKLREKGVKITHQRLEILRVILEDRGHPTTAEICRAVRRKMPTIALDTVYRTVSMFTEIGLIHPVGYSTEGLRFDPAGNPHHHFLCLSCGGVFDFSSRELDDLPVPTEASDLGSVTGSRVEILGICNECLSRKEAPEVPASGMTVSKDDEEIRNV